MLADRAIAIELKFSKSGLIWNRDKVVFQLTCEMKNQKDEAGASICKVNRHSPQR